MRAGKLQRRVNKSSGLPSSSNVNLMKNGHCPKCDSNNVHVVNSMRNQIVVPLGILSMVGSATSLYVCVQCGYLELYVQDPTDLPKIAETWPKLET